MGQAQRGRFHKRVNPIQGPPQFPPECQQHGVPVVVATHQLRVRRAAALPRVQHHHVDEVLQASGRVESHPRKTSERSLLRREHPPMNQPVPEPSQKTGETSAQTNSSAWPTPFSPQKLPSPNPPSLNPPLLKPSESRAPRRSRARGPAEVQAPRLQAQLRALAASARSCCDSKGCGSAKPPGLAANTSQAV